MSWKKTKASVDECKYDIYPFSLQHVGGEVNNYQTMERESKQKKKESVCRLGRR